MNLDNNKPQKHHQFTLCETQGVLSLHNLTNPKATPVSSRDIVKEWYLRTKTFRGKQEPISKTLGLAKRPLHGAVIDTTAGLGRDSITMTALGCQVIMIERELTLACILQQALKFAAQEPWYQALKGNLILQVGEATDYITNMGTNTIISAYYCDPMFTHKVNKSAHNKRLIQTLQHLCHTEKNATEKDTALDQFLLHRLALGQRLIVKRALHETPLKPYLNYQIKGSTFRFDVHYRGQ